MTELISVNSMSNLSNKYYDLHRLYHYLMDHVDSLTKYTYGLTKYDTDFVSDEIKAKAKQLSEETTEQINIIFEYAQTIQVQIEAFHHAVHSLDRALHHATKMADLSNHVKSNVISTIEDLL